MLCRNCNLRCAEEAEPLKAELSEKKRLVTATWPCLNNTAVSSLCCSVFSESVVVLKRDVRDPFNVQKSEGNLSRGCIQPLINYKEYKCSRCCEYECMAKGIPAALSLNIFERNIDTRQTLQTARLLVICLLVVAFFFAISFKDVASANDIH